MSSKVEQLRAQLNKRILVLDGGRLVGAGAHEDVYANCPIYRSLWDRQNAVQQGAL